MDIRQILDYRLFFNLKNMKVLDAILTFVFSFFFFIIFLIFAVHILVKIGL